MKKLILGTVVLLFSVWLGLWVTFNVRTKAKYDEFAKEVAIHSKYSIKFFDAEFSNFLSNVEITWSVRTNQINGPHSLLLKVVGLEPSVTNLVNSMICPLPEWSWISLEQNRRSTILAMFKGQLSPITVDGAIHISSDKKTAVLWYGTNVLEVYRDETNGMREILYFKKRLNQPAGLHADHRP